MTLADSAQGNIALGYGLSAAHHRRTPDHPLPSGRMLTKIRLQNYMSHAETELDLHPGVNVIIGPNNCGKSAILSALQTLLGDNDGDYMVRHGEKECVVEVHTDDPHVIVWHRRAGAIRYRIDGKEFARAGRGNFPDGFHEVVRLSKVTTSDEKRSFDVHFGQQKLPVFLLDSETDTAKFFSTTSDAERLIEMQVRHRRNTQNATDRQREARKQQTRLQAWLATLAPLDEVARQIEQTEAAQEQLNHASAMVEAGTRLQTQWAAAMAARQRLQREATECARLTEPPQLRDTAALERALERIARAQHAENRLRRDYGALAELPAPPDLTDTSALVNSVQLIAQTERHREHARRAVQGLQTLDEPPLLTNVAPLARLITALEECRKDQTSFAAEATRLGALAEPPAVVDPEPVARHIAMLTDASARARRERMELDSLLELQEPASAVDTARLAAHTLELERATSLVQTQRATLQRLELELSDVQVALTRWRESNPACPVCGQPLPVDPACTDGPHAERVNHVHG